jgi:hypothetical protein
VTPGVEATVFLGQKDAILFWPIYSCKEEDNAYLDRVKLHVSAFKLMALKRIN